MWDPLPFFLLKKLILEKAGLYLWTESSLALDLELGPLLTAPAGLCAGRRKAHMCSLWGSSLLGGRLRWRVEATHATSYLSTQGCDKTEGGESGAEWMCFTCKETSSVLAKKQSLILCPINHSSWGVATPLRENISRWPVPFRALPPSLLLNANAFPFEEHPGTTGGSFAFASSGSEQYIR